jgi:hypothetical protein
VFWHEGRWTQRASVYSCGDHVVRYEPNGVTITDFFASGAADPARLHPG